MFLRGLIELLELLELLERNSSFADRNVGFFREACRNFHVVW
jgi:hypothetical protein